MVEERTVEEWFLSVPPASEMICDVQEDRLRLRASSFGDAMSKAFRLAASPSMVRYYDKYYETYMGGMVRMYDEPDAFDKFT